MKTQFTGKDCNTGKDRRQEEKGTKDRRQEEKRMAEDEMVGWHQLFNGHD